MLRRILVKIYRKILRKNSTTALLESFVKLGYVSVGANLTNSGILVEVRNPEPRKTYLKIGNDCLIAGKFVFEVQSGEIIIGNNTSIGGGLFIAIKQITIGNNVLISWGCTFADNNSHSVYPQERATDVADWKRGVDEGKIGYYKDWSNVKADEIHIHDNVWIGFNCIILKGVTIGEGSVIGAGSVVTKSVPPFSVYAGNPARFIRKNITN